MIYLDNAASTWPKPKCVAEAMVKCIEEYGANPGRGSHRLGQAAAKTVFQVRSAINQFFGGQSPDNIIFTQNATESLNLAIKGYLHSGDHVIATSYEHNSVRRPLEFMKTKGVEVTYVRPNAAGDILLEDMQAAVQKNTKLIAVTHASNVTGSLMDIRKIGQWANSIGVRFLVDASQTAGIFPIDIQTDYIDLLAVTGHKSLYGPQGTGFLYVAPDIELVPLMHGGTGGNSETPDQPAQRPDRYEAGTRNVAGIAGLGAGIGYVQEIGINSILNHESNLTGILLTELQKIDHVQLLGPDKDQPRAPIVSFTVTEMDSAEIGFILDQQFDIAVRTGLHCSPLTHQAVGTIDSGAVRVSHSLFTTEDDIIQFIEAIQAITRL